MLREALAGLGVDAEVKARDRLAVIAARSAVGALTDRGLRDRVVAAAARAGFSHLAVELTDDSLDDAALPGRQPA